MNNRRSSIVSILAVGCFIATTMLVPSIGNAQLDLPAVAKTYSPIEQVGCTKEDRCPYGYHDTCGDRHKCWCSPCYLHGYSYRGRYYRYPPEWR